MAGDPELKKYLTFFNRAATIEHENRNYKFTESDFKKLNTSLNYWHHKQDPSSWLCEATVRHGRRKFEKLPRKKLIRLCAATLNITAKKLEDALDWNAHYMAWHDGGHPEDYHACSRDEEQ